MAPAELASVRLFEVSLGWWGALGGFLAGALLLLRSPADAGRVAPSDGVPDGPPPRPPDGAAPGLAPRRS